MDPSFVTTLHYPRRQLWTDRSDCLTADAPPPLVRGWRLWRAARPGRPVVINGFSRVDRLIGVLIARLRPGLRRRGRVPLVVSDATWSRGRGPVDRMITRLGVRLLAAPSTLFCVSSHAEAARWPRLWGVPTDRLAVVHWHHGIDDPPPDRPPAGDGTVFTGGHALRDYATVLAAAARTPVPMHIAADAADLPAGIELPPTVTVGRLDRDSFHRRLAEASLVIVSLDDAADRSAGQTTFLDAMALGGLVAVSRTLGIEEHITDDRTGRLFPPGDAGRLAELITWSVDPATAADRERIRAAAIEQARDHFSPEIFVTALLAAVETSRTLVPSATS